jgi:hypothetical protein
MAFEAIYKGYPYDSVKSVETFPNRPMFNIDDQGRVVVVVDNDIYPHCNIEDEQSFKDFLIHRLYDYDKALGIAEQQITDILTTDPFIPEDFGFVQTQSEEPLMKVWTIGENKCTLVKVIDEDGMYRVMTKDFSVKANFYSSHMAFAFFVALGIIDPKADVSTEYILTLTDEDIARLSAGE